MKTQGIIYRGQAPETVEDQHLTAIVELFKQQNEIIREAATRVLLVPRGTKLEAMELRTTGDDDA